MVSLFPEIRSLAKACTGRPAIPRVPSLIHLTSPPPFRHVNHQSSPKNESWKWRNERWPSLAPWARNASSPARPCGVAPCACRASAFLVRPPSVFAHHVWIHSALRPSSDRRLSSHDSSHESQARLHRG
jgi:hypothetical protein